MKMKLMCVCVFCMFALSLIGCGNNTTTENGVQYHNDDLLNGVVVDPHREWEYGTLYSGEPAKVNIHNAKVHRSSTESEWYIEPDSIKDSKKLIITNSDTRYPN